MPDRIWIWFADNGNIRKWQSTPFDEGTEYVPATALADRDAKIAELERENSELRTQDDPAFTYAFVLRAREAEAQVAELTQKLERATEALNWIDTWVSNPVSSYSVYALDGLFSMTRDRLAFLDSGASQNG